MFDLSPKLKYNREADTPAYKVFNYHYSVSVPNIFLRTLEQMESEGVYTSGYDDIDKALAEQETPTIRSIAQLALLLEDGCEFLLLGPDGDANQIHQVIVEHLTEWADELNNSTPRFRVNPRPDSVMSVVMEDLRMLEQLANYVKVRFIDKIPIRQEAPTGLLSQLQSFGMGGFNSEFVQKKQEATHPANEAPVNLGANNDLFNELVNSPTTLGRMQKWRR